MRRRLVALLCISAGALNGCDGENRPVEPAAVESVVLSAPTTTLSFGQTTQITATVRDVQGTVLTGRSLAWASSNPALAPITASGLLTAGAVRGPAAEPIVITGTVEGRSGTLALRIDPIPVASITLSGTGASPLSVGQTLALTALTLDQTGTPVSGRTVTWSSSTPAVVAVSTAGVLNALAPGTATISATAEGKSASTTVQVRTPIASITLDRSAATLRPGQSLVLAATARDISGATLAGRTLVWQSSAPTIASIDQQGTVSAVSPGTATVTVSGEGKSATATIRVEWNGDAAVLDVAWTQATQRGGQGGQIPMVRDGLPAVVNVVLQPVGQTAVPSTVLLRLTDVQGIPVYHDTVRAIVPSATASLAAPNAQFLVPVSQLRAGLRWQVIRDPAGIAPDTNTSNDRYPASPAPLQTVSVPPVNVRFVPIVLAAHAGVTGNVSTANVPEYLRSTRAFLPLGRIDAIIGTPLTTNANFGTAPSGGAPSFWLTVLSELNLARLTDTSSVRRHWYGIVQPPSGFTSVTNGGYGLIGAPTALSVQVNWFSRPTQATDLVAHELGHNFGRQHTPCGGAGSPDPNFPLAGGVIGETGHNVFDWFTGIVGSAAPITASRGDIMGYCFPAWIHPYTYEGILSARTTSATQAGVSMLQPSSEPRTRVLAIRGALVGSTVSVEPAVTLVARPTPDAGSVVVQLLDDAGRVLTSRRVTPEAVDHAAAQLFTATVPITASLESRIAAIRVTAQGWPEAHIEASPIDPLASPRQRVHGTTTTITCGDPRARGVVVRDATSGALFGIGRGAEITVATTRPTVASCSNGVRSVERDFR